MDRRPQNGGTNPPPRRSISAGAASPFVGRDEEMRRLSAALSRAAAGQGGAVFLTGESGIGKTRLGREVLALAKQRRFTVLGGRAYSLGVGLSYAPLLEAFGPLLRGLDPIHKEALVRDLPDLGRLFSSLRLPLPAPLGDPALEKTRLFEAVFRLLERLAQEAPVVLFIDDVHWADHATLELLRYLARGLLDWRVLMLATHGGDVLPSSRNLQALVDPLLRDGLAEQMVITRLDPAGTGKLVQGILGGDAPSELLALLDARAAGTPLFIESLIDALIASGSLVRNPSEKDGWILDAEGASVLPANVRRLIAERLDRLRPPDRRVLDLVAVLGDGTSYAILRAISGLKEETLVESLRRLIAGGLVAEKVDGLDLTYNITHPLVQEVACAQQPESLRRRAHVAAIEAIESSPERRPNDVYRLAGHYRGAGSEANGDRALVALIEAGEQALSIYANDGAARHFEAALVLLKEGLQEGRGLRVESREDLPSTLNSQPSTLAEVLERLGEAWKRGGENGLAIRVWSQAVAERERAGDGVAIARLRCRLAGAEYELGHFDVAETHLSAGLAVLTDRDPCQELADLHFVRHRLLSWLGDAKGVAETAAELLSVAGRLPSPRAKAAANLAGFASYLWQGDLTNAREQALNALAIGESALGGQGLMVVCQAHIAMVVLGMHSGDHHSMRYHAERGLAVAQRLGAPIYEVLFRLHLAHADFLSGAWDESLRWSTEAITLARRIGHSHDLLAYVLAERAIVLALRGDLPAAEAGLSQAKSAFTSPSTVGRELFRLLGIAEATVALERGQAAHALGICEGFVRASELAPAPFSSTRSFMPIGLMLLAEAQVAGGDPERALETADKLLGLGPPSTPYLIALASRAEGLARRALGERVAAVVSLTRAHETFTALEMPFEAARALLEQAEIRGEESEVRGQDTGDGEVDPDPHRSFPEGQSSGWVRTRLAPAQAAQQSLAIFERLGARQYAGRARRLLQGLGFSSPATRWARLGGVSLSERELEIARLVAEGLTTAEIAERLTISRRTVTTHLEHTYARLGINSRAALARCVIEAGLL